MATEYLPVHDAPLIQDKTRGGVHNEGPRVRAVVRARLNWHASRRFARMRSTAFFWYADAATPDNMDLEQDFLNAMQGIRQVEAIRQAEAMEKEGEEGEQGEEMEEGERRGIKDLKQQRSS